MASFLDSLSLGGGNVDVCIAVSATSGMEMAVIDPASGGISAYSQMDLEYNESLREIASFEAFKDCLIKLFQDCNVNPKKANLHIGLPSVWFGHKEGLPLLLDDDAITNIVLGELEQTYIFKRKDPVPFWFDDLVSSNSDSRSVFYTAVQADIITKIREVADELGCGLASVDSSLFTNIKGLLLSGIAAEQMTDEAYSWSLMIVNNSGMQILGMQGRRILEYYEEPIAMKSLEGEEIYSTIGNAAQISLMNTPSSALVIVSQSDSVSAEILSKSVGFGGKTIFVEDNKYKKAPIVQNLNIMQEDQFKVSLQLIGECGFQPGILPVDLNFLASGGTKSVDDVIEIPITKDLIIKLTSKQATMIAGLLLVLVLLLLGIPYLLSSMATNNIQQRSSEVEAQLAQINTELEPYQNTNKEETFDPVTEIEGVLKNNRTKIMAYAALGESIPKNLYLTYFMTGDRGYIDIQGCANSVEDVYVFFKNMKDSLIDSGLRINKLDLKTGTLDSIINSNMSTIDTAPYVFEITNMDESQLQSFMKALTSGSKKSKDEENSEDDSQKDENSEEKSE